MLCFDAIGTYAWPAKYTRERYRLMQGLLTSPVDVPGPKRIILVPVISQHLPLFPMIQFPGWSVVCSFKFFCFVESISKITSLSWQTYILCLLKNVCLLQQFGKWKYLLIEMENSENS